MRVTAAVCSDVGRVRSNNEDNFLFEQTHLTAENRDDGAFLCETLSADSLLCGVFDGMGGEELGEEASLIAAETLLRYRDRLTVQNRDALILRAVAEANDAICQTMTDLNSRRIGTTFSALSVCSRKAKVYNVGDSRAYLMRNGALTQISVDDTMAQSLVNLGMITRAQAKTHPERHKLTQHLGIFPEELIVEPHISAEITLKKRDRILLCSDGLTDLVDDAEIEAILNQQADTSAAVTALVDAALRNGGRDNVTVVLVSVEGGLRSFFKR